MYVTDYHIQMSLAKTERKQHLFENQNNTETKIWAKWGPVFTYSVSLPPFSFATV